MSLEQILGKIKIYEGKILSVTYVWNGEVSTEKGKLEIDKVPSKCLDLSQGDGERFHVPTSANCNIIKITDEEGNILYEQ